MTFDITPTGAQHDLARRTHEFAESVIRPVAADYDARQEFPWPVLEEAAERGFYSPLFYRDLIGDPTGLSLPMFMEELFWGCAGIGLAIVMPALALSAIGQAASPEQMLEWAPECFGAPGDLKLAALAISEPEGGSDVRNLRTRATRDGTGKDADWIIDGHKMWIGNGGIANVHVVNAVVDEELGHRGQALFIVPGGTPGLEMVRKLDKLGCRASHTAELKFNARAGAGRQSARRAGEARTQAGPGPRGHRGRQAFRLGDDGHVRTDPADGGRTGARHRQGRNGIRDRIREPPRGVRRRRSSTTRASRFPLADLATAIDAARLLTWRASWMAATGVPFERGEGSMSQTGRQRGRGPDHRTRDPDDGRLGLHQGPSGGEVVPRCQAVHDL